MKHFKRAEAWITDMNPYPLDLPVSLSIISWIPSIFKAKLHQMKTLGEQA